MKTKILWILLGWVAIFALSQSTSASCFMITPSSGEYLPVSTINPSWVKTMATVDASGIDSLQEFNNKKYELKDLWKTCEEARTSSTWLVKIWLYISYFWEQIDKVFAKTNIKWPWLKLLQIYSRQTEWMKQFEEYDFKDQTSWDEIGAAMEKDGDAWFTNLIPKMSDERLIVWSLLLTIVSYDGGIHEIFY